MFVVAVFAALAFSAMTTVPALADDSVPPPTETPTVEVQPTQEVAPAVETAPITLQDQTAENILASMPEGTDVVVVNEDGETVPLASTEATDIINSNDPIWCPTGVAPNPGVGGCTTAQDSFNGGLIPLLYNKTTNGTIWILGSYQGTTAVEGGAVVLNNGDSLGTTANYALTIKGGWTGSTAGTIDSSNPSEFNVPLQISFWNNILTLSDIEITGVSGTPFHALEIQIYKNVILNNVNVHDNTTGWGGAQVSTQVGTSGNIVISDSSFNNNAGTYDGLIVTSSGTITIKNLNVIGNTTGQGAVLGGKAITLTGSNNFKFNSGDGLVVSSSGAISLNNVTAIS